MLLTPVVVMEAEHRNERPEVGTFLQGGMASEETRDDGHFHSDTN